MTIKSLAHVVRNLGFLLIAWLALAAGFSLVPGAAQKLDIYFPPTQFLTQLPDDVRLIKLAPHVMTVTSTRPDLALSLYRAGARFIMPSETMGCLSASSVQ